MRYGANKGLAFFKKHLNIELSSTIFMCLFSTLVLILAFSNEELWGSINGELSGFIGV